MLLLSAALAQVANSEIPDQLPVSVAVARCQYTPADEACLSLRESGAGNSEKSPDDTLAQMPRRIPAPPRLPRRPPGPYPRMGYPRMAFPVPSPAHVAIGFLIGFTLGAVHPNDNTVRGHVALGLIGGLMGAVIGAGVPSFHLRHSADPWPDDEEEDEMASRSKVAKPASPESAPADVPTTSTAAASPAGTP